MSKTTTENRGRRNIVIGFVTKKSSDKTIKVEVERQVRHERYGKYIKTNSRFIVHDEKNEAQVGDRVGICETRPMSKLKRWKLASVIEKAAREGADQ